MNNQRWRHEPTSRQTCSGASLSRFSCAAADAGLPPMTCGCVTHEPAADGPLAAAEAALVSRSRGRRSGYLDHPYRRTTDILAGPRPGSRGIERAAALGPDRRGEGQYRHRRAAHHGGLSGLRACSSASAPSVQRLLDAGALLMGKTNLDQFATGLVGVRSPYGTPRNVFNAAHVPGGSSSGSGVRGRGRHRRFRVWAPIPRDPAACRPRSATSSD